MFSLQEIRTTYRAHRPQSIGKHRYYSVLVPFVEKDGELHLMYEVRAHDLEADPGEICFPGGAIEPGEIPSDTALREMEEETGIPASCVEYIGPGNILYGFANYTLYSYIGIVPYEAYCNAKPQESEVAELFLAKVTDIAQADHRYFNETVEAQVAEDFPYQEVGINENYNWRKGRWTISVFEAAGRVIWGLTARITEDVLETLEASRGTKPTQQESKE